MSSPRVGRLLLESERAARMAEESAAGISGEGLRSAFAISAKHVLTASHCVRDAAKRGDRLWFRLRIAGAQGGRRYEYVPVRVHSQDQAFDVAVLMIDESGLGEAGLSEDAAEELLAGSVIPLGLDVSEHEPVRVMGFPANAPSADSDTLPARVVDSTLPLGEVTGLKLVGESFAAVDPVDPHGLSGGPVLKSRAGDGGLGAAVAVGVVRTVPVGRYAGTALGGGLIATRVEDIAGRLPEVAAALLADVPARLISAGSAQRSDTSLSALLRADAELVDFLGRDRERRDLHAWCDGPARAAWLVTGPGGQGKTRLARQLCSELTGSGAWVAAMLHGPGDIATVRDLCRRAAAVGRSLLLVVDYAAEYGAAAFADMVAVLTSDPVRLPRWRLLLLARNTGDWWQPQASGSGPGPAVRPQLIAHGVEVPEEELALQALIPDPQARRPIFDQILAQIRPVVLAFASTHGMAVADPPVAPDLSEADLGSALMLHVAAIVSLLPPAGRPLKPTERPSASDLINRILDLECERHWLYVDAGKARLYRPAKEAFGDLARGSDSRINLETAVAVATLTGAPTAYAAAQLVARALDVDQTRARNIARWLHDLYPAPDTGPETTWLPPLQPDRLGEELIARVIRRQQAEGTPAGQLLPRRVLGNGPDSLTAGQVHRLLTVMIRLGSRDRDIADLLAAHSGHGGLVGDIPREIDLNVVESALPRANTNLLGVAVAVTAHAVQHYDFTHAGWRELNAQVGSTHPTLAEGSRLLGHLAIRLSEAVRWREALAAGDEAVNICRRLAEADPAAHLPSLAGSLTNLGNLLAAAGQQEEALAAADEAVNIYFRLAQAGPVADLPGVAHSLTNLGVRLAVAGRREEALAATHEAVKILRLLAEADPAVHLPILARPLINLGNLLAEAGRQEEGLAAADEAVNIFRLLSEADPVAHLPDLAVSLIGLEVFLAAAGRQEEAVAAAEEAVKISRRLAEANPAVYLSSLAASLINLGNGLAATGRQEEALAAKDEAVNILRLLEGWQKEEALAAADEAVKINRQLAEADPAAHLPSLARSLASLGNLLAEAGRQEEGLAAAGEAVNIYFRLAEADPAAHLPDLARSLTSLGNRLAATGQWQEALAAGDEAVKINRRLAAADPAAYLPSLAGSLTDRGVWLAAAGWTEECLAALGEAVKVYCLLAEADPAAHLPDLAQSLYFLGRVLAVAGRPEEADQVWDDAMVRLGAESHVLSLLRAGWEWVSTSTDEAEREYLAAHPELLAPGSEDQLGHVLRYQPPAEAKRYLALLETARVQGVHAAYHKLH